MTLDQIKATLNTVPVIDIAERARLVPNTVFNLRNSRNEPRPDTVERVQQAIHEHRKDRRK